MGTNKEVFKAELYSIAEALDIVIKGRWTRRRQVFQMADTQLTKVHIWTDSQVVIAMLQYIAPGPRQWVTWLIIHGTQVLVCRRTETEIHWVQGHMGGERNKRTVKVVKMIAVTSGARRCPKRFVSLAYICRTITEKK